MNRIRILPPRAFRQPRTFRPRHTCRPPHIAAMIVAVLFTSGAAAVLSHPAPAADAPAPVASPSTAAMITQSSLKSPQAVMKCVLNAYENRSWEGSVAAFDFEDIPGLTLLEKENYAYQFAQILRRLDHFSIAGVPDSPEENVCRLQPDPAYGEIVLYRSASGGWRVSRETVAEIPAWYKQIRDKMPVLERSPLFDYLPTWFFLRVGSLMVIHYVVMLFFLIAGYVAKLIFPIVTSWIIELIFSRHSPSEYTELLRRALKPFAWFVMYSVWMTSLWLIPVKPSVQQGALFVLHLLSILQITLTLYLMVDVFRMWLSRRWISSTNKVRLALVDLLIGVMKILVICTGCIAIVQVLGYSPLGVISGLGIGGIAVALAAQQTIANFFGSLTILMDQPFSVGDFIICGTIEGTVESVGLRSTRIRTPANSLVYIPNSLLSAGTIDNLGRRFSRRFKTTIGLQYDTPVPLFRAFSAGVRKLILENPRTRKDDIRVHVNNFSSSSIDIELICFFIVPDVQAENAQREQLILEIIELAKELGVSFAFPTQTNYLITSENPTYPAAWEISDGERSKAFGEQCATTILDRKRKPEPPIGKNT